MAEIKEKILTRTTTTPELSLYDRFQGLEMSPEDRVRVEEAERARDRRASEDATISEGVTPKWHVIEVRNGAEFEVRDTLAERRFGVYLPTYRVWENDRYGKTRMRIRRLITNYVFVFVWDIDQHWSRITSVEGVVQILKDGGKAATIPDAMIAHLRILEVYVEEQIEFDGQKKKKRKRRKKKHAHQDGKIDVRIYPVDGEWDRLWHAESQEALDAENRRAVFQRAIGLAS